MEGGREGGREREIPPGQAVPYWKREKENSHQDIPYHKCVCVFACERKNCKGEIERERGESERDGGTEGRRDGGTEGRKEGVRDGGRDGGTEGGTERRRGGWCGR
jgi:hypothetical protein